MAHTYTTDLDLVSLMTKPHTNSSKTDLLEPEGERRQHGQLPAMSVNSERPQLQPLPASQGQQQTPCYQPVL